MNKESASIRLYELKNPRQSASTKSGFTLIEILIVVSIVGLLASVVLVGLGGFRSRGRDARRVTDIRSLQNGFELYYTKYGTYPPNVDALLTGGIGVNKIPKDPTSQANYLYSLSNDKQSYILAATLDATSGDAMFNDSYQGSTSGYTGSVNSCAPPVYCVQF